MKTVYKYILETADRQTLALPQYAQILTVQPQGSDWQLWAMVDTSQPKVERHIVVFGTGHEIPSDLSLSYIATFQQYTGKLVFHVFEDFPDLRGKR